MSHSDDDDNSSNSVTDDDYYDMTLFPDSDFDDFLSDNVDGNPNPAPNNNSTTPDQADAKESDEPQSKKVKHNDSFDKSGEACPICFEPWTNSGEHRLVSLLCGHLFGKLCIEKWMKISSTGRVLKGKCPQCNAVTKSKDVRPIYPRYLKVLDTSERDRAVKELQAEQELRKKAELRLQRSIEENNRLKKELIEHQRTNQELRQARYESGPNGVHVNGLAQANSTQNHPRSGVQCLLNLLESGTIINIKHNP